MTGPALVICPECGEEIGRELIHIGSRSLILPLPRTCPVCDAPLGLSIRPKIAPKGQATLAGVA